MKYCKQCGTQMDDEIKYCPLCGAEQPESKHLENEPRNGMAIAGFILAFFIPLLGWIFGGIGLSRANKGGKNKGLAIAAIIIATVNWILSIYLFNA